ncbi:MULTISPECIES: hypothetical protein [unclassified Moraxella]|uniref:hypothetical protein n=1 Tax=unclassified Moraxella TaxID=2685852 RepID=UPI003AF8284E
MCCRCQLNPPKSPFMKGGVEKRWERNPAFDYQPNGIVRDAREQVWDILRLGEGVTTTAICEQVTQANRKQVEYWLKGWIAGGFVKVIGAKRPFQNIIVRDIGQEPPRVDSFGKPVATPLNESAWRAMRIQKTFNARQIVASTGANLQVNTVRTYLRQLAEAGYLKAVSVEQGMLTTYQLMEDTGCKPPQVLRGKRVFDQNLGIIVYEPTKSVSMVN